MPEKPTASARAPGDLRSPEARIPAVASIAIQQLG
jgi:hypothetical protein